MIPTDATAETDFTPEMLHAVAARKTPAAKYIAAYPVLKLPVWDELTVAVWLTPSLILHQDIISLDVDTNSGLAGYGDTLSWRPGKGAGTGRAGYRGNSRGGCVSLQRGIHQSDGAIGSSSLLVK